MCRWIRAGTNTADKNPTTFIFIVVALQIVAEFLHSIVE